MEFDIFMQYYSYLRDQLNLIDVDKLFDQFYGIQLITHDDHMALQHQFHYKKCVPDLILTRLASHLLSGETILFHKMLEILNMYSGVSTYNKAIEIQVVLHRRLLGMYIVSK